MHQAMVQLYTVYDIYSGRTVLISVVSASRWLAHYLHGVQTRTLVVCPTPKTGERHQYMSDVACK